MTQPLENLTFCTLMGWFWPKYIMFQLKKYKGVMSDGTQDWYKVWRKTDLCFQKLTWGIWQIFTRALESLQIGTLMTSFCLKLKMYEHKIYKGFMCHDNEEWRKNWREIDLSVQNWQFEIFNEFNEFWPKHFKISKICILRAAFDRNIKCLCYEKYRGVILTALNNDAKFERKITCAFKDDMRNLANFDQSMFGSLKIGTLMGPFYPK